MYQYEIGSDEEDDSDGSASSNVRVGPVWEAVGPFPSGMREHPLTASPLHAYPSTTFPADPDVDFARRPFSAGETWPSEYGNGGRAGWTMFEADEDGWVEVSYPGIRWDQLRGDHGWASLQYQTLLRTYLAIPAWLDESETPLLVDVIQGAEYAFVPLDRDPELPVIWYQGDLYDYASLTSGSDHRDRIHSASNLARSIILRPGWYIMLVRAIYEIRMFGDPRSGSRPQKGPTIRLRVQVEVDRRGAEVLPGLGIVPDVVDGWIMGNWISVGIRAGQRDLRLLNAQNEGSDGLKVQLPRRTTIRSGQIRPVALRITQPQRLALENSQHEMKVCFLAEDGSEKRKLWWAFRLSLHRRSNALPFKTTFASPQEYPNGPPASVSYAMVIPSTYNSAIPSAGARGRLPPVILALHGAGVDAANPAWAEIIPKRDGGWAVLPTGRTEWGEDWHGGSMDDAWAARDALPRMAERLGEEVSHETLLIGHSNGGQGAWHIAARYPDRVSGVIAASGWLTIHDYVPYTEQISGHFADPALMGILRSSLTPYDNDLHASNLVGLPVLAIHGAEDDNVPPRHSRAHVATIAAWAGNEKNVQLLEVPRQGHIWPDIFKHPEVTRWMDELPPKGSWEDQREMGFTLTCGNPQECGGRAGIRIRELEMPGRLARLEVIGQGPGSGRREFSTVLRGTNVRSVTFTDRGVKTTLKRDRSVWVNMDDAESLTPPRAYGPMIRILATTAPLIIVQGYTQSLRSLARRIAHDVYVHHRIDVEILDPRQALERLAMMQNLGNVVCVGRPEENEAVEWMLAQRRIPLAFPTKGVLTINNGPIYEAGTGIIAMHPHPLTDTGLAVIIAGNDDDGLELAARLFPIRTGVTVPDWAIVSPRMQWQGAGGLVGAGFWGADWRYSESMSWLDR